MTVEQALREELARIVDAVAIQSPAAFTLGGRPSSGIALPVIGLNLTPDMPPLMNELVMQLYQHCFASRWAGQAAPYQPPPTASDARMGRVAGARQSEPRAVGGRMADPAHHAQRGRRGAARQDVAHAGAGRVHQPQRLRHGSIARGRWSGCTFRASRARCRPATTLHSARRSPTPTTSSRWCASTGTFPPRARRSCCERISGDLNRWEVPFRFKTPSHPGMFARTDTAVLYAPRRYAHFTRELVAEIHSAIRPFLRDDVPLFTLRLAPGLAFAEDPGTQESFGMCRSRILAQGIWQAHVQGAHGTAGAVEGGGAAVSVAGNFAVAAVAECRIG